MHALPRLQDAAQMHMCILDIAYILAAGNLEASRVSAVHSGAEVVLYNTACSTAAVQAEKVLHCSCGNLLRLTRSWISPAGCCRMLDCSTQSSQAQLVTAVVASRCSIVHTSCHNDTYALLCWPKLPKCGNADKALMHVVHARCWQWLPVGYLPSNTLVTDMPW